MVREEPLQWNPWKTKQENGKKWKLVPQEKTTLLVFRGASERERVYPVVFCLGPVHTGKNDQFSFDAFQKYLHKDGFTAKPLRAVGTL